MLIQQIVTQQSELPKKISQGKLKFHRNFVSLKPAFAEMYFLVRHKHISRKSNTFHSPEVKKNCSLRITPTVSSHLTGPTWAVYTLRQITEEDEASRIIFATYYAFDSTGSVPDKPGHYVRNNGCMQRSIESLEAFAYAEYVM